MPHHKPTLTINMMFSSLLSIAILAVMLSTMATRVSAQNMSNLTSTTEVGSEVGLVTITPAQIDEIKNSINVTRQALEQGNFSEALANLSIVEEQFSVLTEET
jgi:hypothetical protein